MEVNTTAKIAKHFRKSLLKSSRSTRTSYKDFFSVMDHSIHFFIAARAGLHVLQAFIR